MMNTHTRRKCPSRTQSKEMSARSKLMDLRILRSNVNRYVLKKDKWRMNFILVEVAAIVLSV
jgi:hypothetical protein